MNDETRVFQICEDRSENYFVGRMTRRQDEVKPELWNLPVGGFLVGLDPYIGFMREK